MLPLETLAIQAHNQRYISPFHSLTTQINCRKPVGTKNAENPQRQPLGTIHQQPHHHHHIPSTNTLDDVEDAEIIVIDTPEKPSDSLEDQFTQVDEEFHESRSTMDIDSDDPTTEPDDTDTESTLNSERICVPSTTRHDREELRIVRNNFAEEYDPWDTSMVPDYAEDIFRYMRELEVPLPSKSSCSIRI